ncbi:MAG: aspartate/glutamate racemase family protein [Candidatus Aminicenantales bacterium]|jgi:aspartate racemase
MKTIGLVGGMSWESTLEYYRIINETVKEKLGGFHSAKMVLYSVDFAEVETLQHRGEWDQAAVLLTEAALRVEAAGADFGLFCTNTMHKVFDEIQKGIHIPLIHIADVTGRAITARGLRRVGLLGTRFTMEQDFYKGKLTSDYGIDVLIPDEEERQAIHAIVYNELCLGQVKDTSREAFKKIIARLEGRGAQGIVLGCTEIPLLVKQKDNRLPLFDTTDLHARAAVDLALRD